MESDVAIDKIETINGGCRLLAESIGVRTIIKASNQGAADTMAKALTQDKINDALSKSGLPAAKLLEGFSPFRWPACSAPISKFN